MDAEDRHARLLLNQTGALGDVIVINGTRRRRAVG
jgi:hypothetical protein